MELITDYTVGAPGRVVQRRPTNLALTEPESGFANPANPVLKWINYRNRKCVAVKMASAIVLIDEYGILVITNVTK